MKAAPTAVKNYLVSANTAWRADLITLTLVDASVVRWTTSDRDLLVSGQAYASGPIVSRSMRQSSRLEVDTLSLRAIGTWPFQSTTLARAALLGTFDDARLTLDHVIGAYPGDVSMGVAASWFSGRVAGVEPNATGVTFEVKSDLEELSILQLPRYTYRSQCGYVVYDQNCGVDRGTFTVPGTVSSATTTSVVTTTAGITGKAPDWFNLGVIAFTSGALSGVRRSVRSSSGGTLTLAGVPLPSAPANGTTFTVYPGCSRTQATCSGVFGNIAKFRGFPHIPTTQVGV